MVSTTEIHSPPTHPSKRPKGILKNSSSYQSTPAESAMVSPPLSTPGLATPSLPEDVASPRRPSLHNRELSEREIVQMNTEANAGGASARRNSSNPRGSMSRRQSTCSDGTHDPSANNQRLQWDEANLYLNEGQMGGKMKIDEPKTPFVHGQGDLMADVDEEENIGIDPNQLVVDELDKAKQLDGESPTGSQATAHQQKRTRETDIPDLDLGDPEQDVQMSERRPSDSGSGRRVSVAPEDPDAMDVDSGRHGEGNEADMGDEELAKHRKFENMRKRHYEMGNVKDLLGHPEDLEEEDE